jgi:16S rRNA processing protein RimM
VAKTDKTDRLIDRLDAKLVLATVGRPLGLSGWFYLHGRDEPIGPEFFDAFISIPTPPTAERKDFSANHKVAKHALTQDGECDWRPLRILQSRWQGDQVVVLTDLGHSRTDVESWRGAKIAILRSKRVSVPSRGMLFWSDLKGRSVVTADGVGLGQIDHLYSAGSSDIAAILGVYSVDIPLIPDFIDIKRVSLNGNQPIILEASLDQLKPLMVDSEVDDHSRVDAAPSDSNTAKSRRRRRRRPGSGRTKPGASAGQGAEVV